MERAGAKGRFIFLCFDRYGHLRWQDVFDNLVVDDGKDHMLDTFFKGSGYTAAGPYLGLIAATGYTGIVASDTMASHPGWLEAGVAVAPAYSGGRPLMTLSAAAAGSTTLNTPVSYTLNSLGTVKGGFVCAGPGASSTVGNTGGVLWSAGLFVGGDNGCNPTDVLFVSYTTSL